MTDQTTTEPRVWGPPKAACPSWCKEHVSEDASEIVPNGRYEAHRRILHRHVFPAQLHSFPEGTLTLSVEQSGVLDESARGMATAHAQLTVFPGRPDETSLSLYAWQLRDLIASAQVALVLLEGINQ
jgi:hypothetical protein